MIEPKYPTITQLGRQLWKVETAVLASGDGFPQVRVPVGFETDGASVPRLFWNICPPMSETYTNAAVVHDYIYKRKGDIHTNGTPIHYSRELADLFFLQLMKELGTARWRRRIMYRAVRMFGPRW